ncbi:hypothetical protein [Thermus filiformis]|uniref:Uncharacterized protein n=1 Tax=Thermus filiformis TaxID=276 RepID=A0A0D6XAX3_THEFI|nr:hypothetical protein [Thermus filiformis]KIX84847.1 hypothetical protein THFILI_00165 [Thermus filiformis]
MWKTVLIWSVVAALVMFFFPIKFIGVWGSMFIFPFIAVRQLRLRDHQSPVVAGLAYGALTGALSRFFLAAVNYLLLPSRLGDLINNTSENVAMALSAGYFYGALLSLVTSPLVGAVVGGIAGMIAAGTVPKSKEA